MPAIVPASYQIETASLTEDYKVLTSPLGDSIEQSAPAGLNPIVQKWSVTFIKMTQTEAINLRNIFRQAKGVEPIYWQPPLESSVLKFKVRSHTVNAQNGLIYSISATFEQVY